MDSPLTLFLDAWRYRKWYFIILALVIGVGTAVYAWRLPPVYQSRATVLIEEQQIPPEFVRSTVTGAAEQHIQLITQQILSRSKLLETIEKFDLYPDIRGKASKESLVEMMRKSIKIETISAQVKDKRRSEGVTIAFSISFEGRDPRTVYKVAGSLTSVFLEQNLKYREEQVQTTTRFLEAELGQLRNRLSELGFQIAAYKEKHEGTLPEYHQFNFSQMQSLENELKQLEIAERSAENQKIYLESLLSTTGAAREGDKDKGLSASPTMRLQQVKEQLLALKARYAEEHPDIQRLKREKEFLEKALKDPAASSGKQQRLVQLRAKLLQLQSQYGDAHPEVRQLKAEIDRLQGEAGTPEQYDLDLANPAQLNLLTQIQAITNQLSTLRQQRQTVKEKLALVRSRLEQIPKVEQEYLALQRDYQNTQAKYQEVNNKLMEAKISEGMEEHQKGQRFTLIDPASYPEEPIRPKRSMIILSGVIVGLMAGVGVMLGLELMDPSVKTVEELATITGMPPLGLIGMIESTQDLAAKKRRRLIVAAAGGVVVIVGILLVHFLYRDVSLLLDEMWRRTRKLI